MANDCIPFYEDADRLPAHASAAITGKRFVVLSGRQSGGSPGLDSTGGGGNYLAAVPGAGVKCPGVAAFDAAIGEKVTVILKGVVPVTAGATVTAGSEVEVDNQGRVINLNTGKSVGLCLVGNTVGNDAEILLYN